MKKMMFTLMAMLTIAATANAMSYEQARNEALFLTDKMAYELNLTNEQYEAAYEINLDYLMSVATVDDLYGTYWERRNLDLSYVLFSWQWDLYRAASYFFRPLYWSSGYWHFGIYARYPHRDYFYYGRPHFYASYRGGHSWRMNGGRSYYEHHRDHYRPSHVTRDTHFGMRNGWDRGDYRNHHGHGSSTRVTAGHDNHGGPGNHGNHGNVTPGNHGGSGNHGNVTPGGHGNVNPGNHGNVNRGSSMGGTRNGSMGGTRSSGSFSSGSSPRTGGSTIHHSTPTRSGSSSVHSSTPTRSSSSVHSSTPSRSSGSSVSRSSGSHHSSSHSGSHGGSRGGSHGGGHSRGGGHR